ncbi:Uncharacterized protein APZ42_026586 [Daphnia magna]|uniref:Uncharacterized protein n=1 Tax=Daphnia magna TaxID=35525 RepID=A0A164S4L5_9CRUS|nr:Uncharacterized protein APZ42_026586 [Daphnia magna]
MKVQESNVVSTVTSKRFKEVRSKNPPLNFATKKPEYYSAASYYTTMYAALTYFTEALKHYSAPFSTQMHQFIKPQLDLLQAATMRPPNTTQQRQQSDMEDPCISLMVFPSCSHSKEATPQFVMYRKPSPPWLSSTTFTGKFIRKSLNDSAGSGGAHLWRKQGKIWNILLLNNFFHAASYPGASKYYSAPSNYADAPQYYNTASYYTTKVPEYYAMEKAEYYTTTYAAPAYYTEAPKYSVPSYYQNEAPQYYTTKAPEYYAPAYATQSYYTTTYSAPEYYTTKAPGYYTEPPKYYPAPSYKTEAPKYYR